MDANSEVASRRMLEANKKYLAELDTMHNDDNIKRHLLPHLNGVLKHAVAQCKAVSSVIANIEPMKPKMKIHPNQKLQLQLQPMKKVKKRKATKKGFTGPSSEDRRKILKTLLQSESYEEDDNRYDDQTVIEQSTKEGAKQACTYRGEQSTKETSTPSHHNPRQKAQIQSEQVLRKQRSSFTPPLSSVKSLGQTLYRHGPYNITMVHLKSLETDLPIEEKEALNSHDGKFVTGWLYDSIIDSFFYLLENQHEKILCASCTLMTACLSGSSVRAVWQNVDITRKDFILIPWNSTGGHWVLIVVDVKKGVIMYLDPMETGFTKTAEEGCSIVTQLLHIKFPKGFNHLQVMLPNKTGQKDGRSCGVLVCFYGEQIVRGDSLTSPIITNEYRRRIFQRVSNNAQI
ncbi:uncharacterized protein LOC118407260 [Branchiostoma floridae]|uniref:Uncharacterized protein LOC118407260 n=1 Tax=Branchiostoma floridae TaxID=7739 RepID=A0A9J7HSH2_BRAFL|nr:uncharacterized protein LOC118407260 [Branchiostoma floridae]